MWYGSKVTTAVVLAGVCAGGCVKAQQQCEPEQTAYLAASEGEPHDWFGYSVSISGGVAVVGAATDDDNGSKSGSGYIYRHDGTAWVEEAKLTASDGEADDFLGVTVSISGDWAVLGAIFDDDNGLDSGAAYVYRYDGETWVEEAKLTASDGEAGDNFGFEVEISGNIVVVGAIYDDDHGLDSGAAYVYRYDGQAWVEETKLAAFDGDVVDGFGWSLAITGDVVVVGALWDDDNGMDSGSAYVFRYDGQAWVEEAKLTASDGEEVDYFGTSVAISGDVAVVGAFLDDDNGLDSGSAYVYRYDGQAWMEEAKLTASDGEALNYFGFSVAISGDLAVLGAYLDSPNGLESGSAYVFDLNCTTVCTWDLDGNDVVDTGDLILLLGAWGDPYGTPDLIELLGNWGPCE